MTVSTNADETAHNFFCLMSTLALLCACKLGRALFRKNHKIVHPVPSNDWLL